MARLVRPTALRESLKEDQALIFAVLPGETSESEAEVLSERLLTSEEKARRFVDPNLRHDFIVARSLLRLGLSACFPVPAMDWQFDRDERGKPFLLSPRDLPPFQFSLSHTRGLVALLVTFATQAGVDVEMLARSNDLRLIAQRVCSRRELDSLGALEGAEWETRFFELWTLKEAYAKALGLGLALPFQSVSFAIDGQKRVTTNENSRWQFHLEKIAPRHTLAAALHCDSSARRYAFELRKVRLATLVTF